MRLGKTFPDTTALAESCPSASKAAQDGDQHLPFGAADEVGIASV